MEGREFGRYRLERLIGSGGMGDVYEAVDLERERVVAIKVLPELFSANTEFQERFRRESRIAARLRDPHIIPIHDYGEIDRRLFIDMRLVDNGVTIATLLRDEGPMAPQRAVAIVEQVADALDSAHADGLVHRDIKPSNVLITSRDFVYVVDFGIAHIIGHTAYGLTGSRSTVGTLDYMAPERFAERSADARSDVYSLACLLHECLTAQTPFTATTAPGLMYAHLNLDPPAPSSTNPKVPRRLDQVIRVGMAKEPDDRYPTAGALAAAARHAIGTGNGGDETVARLGPTDDPAAHSITQPAPTATDPLPEDANGDGAGPGRGAETVDAGDGNGTPARPARGPSGTAVAPAGAPAVDGDDPVDAEPVDPEDREPETSDAAAGTAAVAAASAAPTQSTPTQSTPTRSTPTRSTPTRSTPTGSGAPTRSLATGATDSTPTASTPTESIITGSTPPAAPGPAPASAPDVEPPDRRRRRVRGVAVASGAVVVVVVAAVLVTIALVTPAAGPGTPASTQAQRGSGEPPVESVPDPPQIGSITTPPEPGFVAIDPSGRYAYVTNRAPKLLTVLNLVTRRTEATIPMTSTPRFVAVSDDGRRAYVSCYDNGDVNNKVIFVDLERRERVGEVEVDRQPWAVALAPDQRTLWVPSHSTGLIDIVDTENRTVARKVPVAQNPHWITFAGERAYVVNHESNLVTVMDTASITERKRIPVGRSPHAASLSPDGRRLAVVNFDGGDLSMIDTATDTVVGTVPVGQGPQHVLWAPDGRHLYTADVNSDTVTVVDTTTLRPSASVRVGRSPTSVALYPAGTTALVTLLDDGRLELLGTGE